MRFEQEKFERDNWEKFVRGRRLLTWHSFFWPVTDVFCGVQMVAGLYIAALMVIKGSLTLGDYLAYVGMIGMIIWPIRNLGRLVVQMSSGLVEFKVFLELGVKVRKDWRARDHDLRELGYVEQE